MSFRSRVNANGDDGCDGKSKIVNDHAPPLAFKPNTGTMILPKPQLLLAFIMSMAFIMVALFHSDMISNTEA